MSKTPDKETFSPSSAEETLSAEEIEAKENFKHFLSAHVGIIAKKSSPQDWEFVEELQTSLPVLCIAILLLPVYKALQEDENIDYTINFQKIVSLYTELKAMNTQEIKNKYPEEIALAEELQEEVVSLISTSLIE